MSRHTRSVVPAHPSDSRITSDRADLHPTVTSETLRRVRRHYPDARPADEHVHQVLDLLARDLGIEPSSVLLGDSVCSDDANSMTYPARARAMLGPFKLGGLNGFPHAGLTGMGAFAAHAPEGGAVLIYHAPHIGVAEDGTLGVIRRHGQHAPSSCCGAARAALARLQAGTLTAEPPSEFDYQQGTIQQLFLQAAPRILAARDPLLEATEVMAEAVTARIDVLVAATRFPARWLVRVGGILVNGDAGVGACSVLRRATLTDLETGTEHDLRPALAAG